MFGLFIGFRRLGQCLILCFKQEESKALLVSTGTVLMIGTFFYHQVEDMDFIDAFYFSFVTLATIGYGDITPHTILGKLFTVIYGILGLGLVSLSVGVIAREFVHTRSHLSSDKKKEQRSARADKD